MGACGRWRFGFGAPQPQSAWSGARPQRVLCRHRLLPVCMPCRPWPHDPLNTCASLPCHRLAPAPSGRLALPRIGPLPWPACGSMHTRAALAATINLFCRTGAALTLHAALRWNAGGGLRGPGGHCAVPAVLMPCMLCFARCAAQGRCWWLQRALSTPCSAAAWCCCMSIAGPGRRA
jgi:hypothetical protein